MTSPKLALRATTVQNTRMHVVWYVAAASFGLALGLHFGRLFAAIIAHWESVAVTAKAMKGVVLFLLGGAGGVGGTVLFSLIIDKGGAFYLCGLGVGLVITFIAPGLPPRYTRKSIKSVVQMSDALQEKVSDVDERALLILTTLVPPKAIQREGKRDEGQLARELEEATDRIAEPDDEKGDDGTPGG